jgi:hypothetical protein
LLQLGFGVPRFSTAGRDGQRKRRSHLLDAAKEPDEQGRRRSPSRRRRGVGGGQSTGCEWILCYAARAPLLKCSSHAATQGHNYGPIKPLRFPPQGPGKCPHARPCRTLCCPSWGPTIPSVQIFPYPSPAGRQWHCHALLLLSAFQADTASPSPAPASYRGRSTISKSIVHGVSSRFLSKAAASPSPPCCKTR